MAPVAIKMYDYAEFTESVSLDNNEYLLRFYWNTRGEFWSMDISDSNNTQLVSGIKLIVNYPMLYQYKKIGLPNGDFYIKDLNPKTQYVDPGRYDFVSGRNLSICYVSAS